MRNCRRGGLNRLNLTDGIILSGFGSTTRYRRQLKMNYTRCVFTYNYGGEKTTVAEIKNNVLLFLNS